MQKTGRGARRALQASLVVAGGAALPPRQLPAPQPPPPWVAVKPIEPPVTPLPPEAASANVTRFSFIGYGDTRSGGLPGVPGDGDVVHPEHTRVVDRVIAKATELASTPFPLRFVLQS